MPQRTSVIIATIGFLLSGIILQAQNTTAIDLSDLKPPTSPGFAILDVAPNAIERPKTIKEFTVSTTNLFNNGFTFPKDFAFEIVPGWMIKNRNLSFSKLTGLMEKSGRIHQNIFSDVKFSSLSIASVFSDSATKFLAGNTNHIGYGIKINLIKVYSSNKLKAIDFLLNLIDTATKSVLDKDIDPDNPSHGQGNDLRNRTKDQWKEIISLRSLRPLFQLQIAGASSLAFPNNSGGQFHRGGGWATAGWSFPLSRLGTNPESEEYVKKLVENVNYLNAIILARYTNSKFDSMYLAQPESQFDLGARVELELDRLLVGVEYVNRSGNNGFENTHRFAGMIEYKVLDNLFLEGSFGKNFGDFNNVIALFGLNFGFGKQSIFTPFTLDQSK